MRPVQQTLFNPKEMPEEFWAYVVEVKWSREMLDALGRDPRDPAEWETAKRPNHFRLEANAVKRCEELAKEFSRGRALRLVEFRAVPKYIGYIPTQDEGWII